MSKFGSDSEELHAIRMLVAPFEWESTFTSVKRRLACGKAVEETAETCMKCLLQLQKLRVDCEVVGGMGLSDLLKKLMIACEMRDEKDHANVKHPLFHLLPEEEREKALKRKRHELEEGA